MVKRFLPYLLLVAVAAFVSAAIFASDAPKISPDDAAVLVANGQAVLIDVREAAEWASTGVAAPALLLAKSDFDGAQTEWKPFLENIDQSKTVILYCRSGNRSGKIADVLAKQGFKVANAGGMNEWQKAGLPVRRVN